MRPSQVFSKLQRGSVFTNSLPADGKCYTLRWRRFCASLSIGSNFHRQIFSALNIHNGGESVRGVRAAERSGGGLGCFQRRQYHSSHPAKPTRRSGSGGEPSGRSQGGRGEKGSGGGQTPGPARRTARHPTTPGLPATPRRGAARLSPPRHPLARNEFFGTTWKRVPLAAPRAGEGRLLLKRWLCRGIGFCANDATGTDRFRKFRGGRPKEPE